ncbi:hypothetical protein GHK38_22720 [Sinorhizobium meliloti]|uniref:hypothetical protein n=1 Tax=Rhizobium meliloti TaxID=382 RepID=UPI00048221DC|nr:hypothetical protein [Sinorhizobium meliloti]ASQ06350.1 hypothetical protein CDO23_20530 [Sinorhizobium meliloti]MDE3832007.1 hypothetical protein [Sinorhizobium meliloti]MDE4580291.1 hypothetical protein [Sinorhizobium meliloti]MQU70841.1 hypothetical protein [Sinorhizobium meliloti]MQV42345.1 hypothetical protein [Sinorhizobium meliloti]
MAFTITVRNDGATSTVEVNQRININEEQQILNEVIESGGSVSAQAYSTEEDGDERGVFRWKHVGSSMTGQGSIRAGEELVVTD